MAAKQKTVKSTSTSKKGPAKKSPSTKKTNTRTPLKKRKSNGAIPEDKDDDFVFKEKSISDRTELSPFPDDVLKRIFQFCLEEGKEGCYTPQRTLVNVLSVNSVFFTIAGSVLYHSPVVMDLGTFVSGSARMLPIDKFNFNFDPDLSQPEAAALARKSGCTKLVLLQYVKNLTILPSTAPRSRSGYDQDDDQEKYQFTEEMLERLKKDARYYKGQTYERARTILHKQWRSVTPNMVRVTIGNAQNVYGNLKDVIAKIQHDHDNPTEGEDKERVKELTKLKNLITKLSDQFKESIESLRLTLMSRFKPKEWSDYQNAQYRIPFKPEMPNAEYKQHYFPPTWMVHTDLSTEFPLLWGSINKIIVRPSDNTPNIEEILPVKAKDKKRKRRHSWDNESDWDRDITPPPPEFAYAQYAYTTRRQQEDETAEFMGRDYKSVQTILRSIVDSHPRNFGRSLLHSDTKRGLEDKTKFEVYGLERVLELDEERRGKTRQEEELRSTFDFYAFEMYESMQRQFRFRDRFWENSEDKCGPVVKFYTLGELK